MSQLLRIVPLATPALAALWTSWGNQEPAKLSADAVSCLWFAFAIALLLEIIATATQNSRSEAPDAIRIGYANVVRAVNLSLVTSISAGAFLLTTRSPYELAWFSAFTLGGTLLTILVACLWVSSYVKRQAADRELPRGYGAMFYNNPDDGRLWVPKILGFGWTLNFAHTRAWLLFAALLSPLLWVMAGVVMTIVSA